MCISVSPSRDVNVSLVRDRVSYKNPPKVVHSFRSGFFPPRDVIEK